MLIMKYPTIKLHAIMLLGIAVACEKPDNEKNEQQPEIITPTVVEVLSVSLNQKEVSMKPGEKVTLSATVLPEDATDKTVSWSSSNADVAKVSAGVVTAVQDGETVITARAGEKETQCQVRVETPYEQLPIPEAIDMGLSVKWAPFNVGARSPEDYGDYYAWGETEAKFNYSYATYKYADTSQPDGVILTKYNTNEYCGPIDYRIILEEEDDIAHILYGDAWRMPTRTEMNELLVNCTKVWTTQNGIEGLLLTSIINGNELFFPAAGNYYFTDFYNDDSHGMYWSSSLTSVETPTHAASMGFSAEACNPNNLSYYVTVGPNRFFGASIRPVFGIPEIIHPEGIIIEPNRVEIEVGETYQLQAIVLPENATDKTVTWMTENYQDKYVTVSASGEVTGIQSTEWSSTSVVAITNDGAYVARCNVKVKDKAASIPIFDHPNP